MFTFNSEIGRATVTIPRTEDPFEPTEFAFTIRAVAIDSGESMEQSLSVLIDDICDGLQL